MSTVLSRSGIYEINDLSYFLYGIYIHVDEFLLSSWLVYGCEVYGKHNLTPPDTGCPILLRRT